MAYKSLHCIIPHISGDEGLLYTVNIRPPVLDFFNPVR